MPLFRLCLTLLICGCLAAVGYMLTDVRAIDRTTNWTTPTTPALHNLGSVQGIQAERDHICTPLTYRMVDDMSHTTHTGCFVRAAFGLYDQAQSVGILRGTDEAIHFQNGGQPATLSIPPHSGMAARFGGFPGIGAYYYFYPNLPAVLSEKRGWPSLQRYKDIGELPSQSIRDASGQALKVNPQTFAYAARSQWIVTESPAKALVRVSMADHSIVPFDTSYYASGNPYATHKAAMAVTQDGRYVAAFSLEYKRFTIYDLTTCSGDSGPNALAPLSCESHNYWPFIASQVSGQINAVSKANFMHNGLLAFTVTTSRGEEQYALSPNPNAISLIPYLGLGDSFASGQGAFNYLPGTDSATNVCHNSAHAYPWLISQSHYSDTGKSIACSGARMHDITQINKKYSGQNKQQISTAAHQASGNFDTILQSFTPGYVAQQHFVTHYQPGVITVQIGGNDVGFGNMLIKCLSPIASLKPTTINSNSCYESREDRIEVSRMILSQHKKWVQTFSEIAQAAPASRVYAIGYPQIVSPRADCALNSPLTSGDIAFARDVTELINQTIHSAAQSAGVTYVDVSDAFSGSELCSGAASVAVNGVTAGNDGWGLGQESFHPNAFGHELLHQAIITQTDNFTLQAPTSQPTTPEISNDHPLLVDAPETGRKIRNLKPAANPLVPRGIAGSHTVHITSTDYAIKPHTTYEVHYGDTNIASGSADEQGNMLIPISIPTPVEPVIEDITITCTNQHKEDITIIETVIVYPPNTADDDTTDVLPYNQSTVGQPPQDNNPPAGSTPAATTSGPHVAASYATPTKLHTSVDNTFARKPKQSGEVPRPEIPVIRWWWFAVGLLALLLFSTGLEVAQYIRSKFMAEREGFEPSEPLPAHLFSRQASSTTPAPLRDSLLYSNRGR